MPLQTCPLMDRCTVPHVEHDMIILYVILLGEVNFSQSFMVYTILHKILLIIDEPILGFYKSEPQCLSIRRLVLKE